MTVAIEARPTGEKLRSRLLLWNRTNRMPTPSVSKSTESVSRGASKEDLRMVEAMRHGDESTFDRLVAWYHASLLRFAMAFVPSQTVAEEVVQETWLAVLEGIHQFEGRSSLRSWIFAILKNQAKTRGVRESRHVLLSAVGSPGDDSDDPSVEPERFHFSASRTDHWAVPPRSWDEITPERLLLSKESREYLEGAMRALPLIQQQVIRLRYMKGFTTREICKVLRISENNHHVLLHRGRAKLKPAIEYYLNGDRSQANPFRKATHAPLVA